MSRKFITQFLKLRAINKFVKKDFIIYSNYFLDIFINMSAKIFHFIQQFYEWNKTFKL